MISLFPLLKFVLEENKNHAPTIPKPTMKIEAIVNTFLSSYLINRTLFHLEMSLPLHHHCNFLLQLRLRRKCQIPSPKSRMKLIVYP